VKVIKSKAYFKRYQVKYRRRRGESMVGKAFMAGVGV